MYCYCRDEFDWLMKMLEEGKCFMDYERLNNFIDDSLLQLRYMKKRFGYLFYDDYKYIKKVNGRNAIFVNKEYQYVFTLGSVIAQRLVGPSKQRKQIIV